MIDTVLAKVFGTKNEREVKAMLPTVAAIGELEPQVRALSDIDLAAKTIEFKERLAQEFSIGHVTVQLERAGLPAQSGYVMPEPAKR